VNRYESCLNRYLNRIDGRITRTEPHEPHEPLCFNIIKDDDRAARRSLNDLELGTSR
jgi:hypothetical protein